MSWVTLAGVANQPVYANTTHLGGEEGMLFPFSINDSYKYPLFTCKQWRTKVEKACNSALKSGENKRKCLHTHRWECTIGCPFHPAM